MHLLPPGCRTGKGTDAAVDARWWLPRRLDRHHQNTTLVQSAMRWKKHYTVAYNPALAGSKFPIWKSRLSVTRTYSRQPIWDWFKDFQWTDTALATTVFTSHQTGIPLVHSSFQEWAPPVWRRHDGNGRTWNLWRGWRIENNSAYRKGEKNKMTIHALRDIEFCTYWPRWNRSIWAYKSWEGKWLNAYHKACLAFLHIWMMKSVCFGLKSIRERFEVFARKAHLYLRWLEKLIIARNLQIFG